MLCSSQNSCNLLIQWIKITFAKPCSLSEGNFFFQVDSFSISYSRSGIYKWEVGNSHKGMVSEQGNRIFHQHSAGSIIPFLTVSKFAYRLSYLTPRI